MINKKKLIIIFMFIVLSNFVFSDLNTDTEYYFAMEDLTSSNGAASLTNNGASSGSIGIIDDCYSYTTNDYMESDFDSFGKTEMSFDGWIYTNSIGAIQMMFRERTSSSTNYFRDFVSIAPTGKVQAQFRPSADGTATGTLSSTTTLTTGTWYYVAFTIDTVNDEYKLYIDSVLEDTDTTTLPTIENVASNQKMQLGGGHGSGYLNGRIDEFGIYDSVLSQTDIDFRYNSGNPGSSQQYLFDLSSGFTVSHISPLNNTVNNTNLYNGYEVTDTTNTSINCYLYINSTINQTQINITVNSTLYFNTSFIYDNEYNYQVRCSNGIITSNTTINNYIYDTTKPFINIISPNVDNTTIFTYDNRSLNLNINIQDQHLYKGNLTIYNSSGVVMYNNYTGDITGNTSFTWNDIININTWTTGLYTGFIEASDSHTAKSIKDGFNPIKEKDTKIKYKTPKEWGNTEFYFEYIGKNKIKSYKDIKKFDRHSININFDKVNGFRWEEFYINADKPLKYIKNSDYPCHIVSETGMVGLWFDCVYSGMDNDIQIVEKINDYEYKINIYTDNEIIEFNSLGGLNNNNASFNFNILENLTIIANDTNTGLLISNFSVIYDSNIYTASGTNLTISVLANTTHNILVSAIGYGSYNNNTFVGFSPKTLTVNLTSGGTVLKFYDEKTNSLITSTNVTVDMVGNISGRFSTSLGSITISGLPTGNYSAVYFADGYAPREYPIELNATGLEIINLYLCNSSICEDIIVNVFDTVGSGLPDYEVQVLKLIDGNYILVEKAISNFEGQTGISAITFEPSYKFLVVKDNIVQKTTGETEIYSDTLNFFISEFESIIQRYIKLGNFQYILRYDEPLNQFQLSYLDPTSNLSEVCLRVTSKTNYTEEILYNETCLNSFSGVINVNVVEQIGTTYTAKIFTSFSPEQYVDTLVKKFDDVLNSGKVGLWMTLLLILIVAFVGIWFPSISILFIAIILWITRVLGLHEFGYTTITGITVGCVIFSYIFAKVN